MAEDARRKHDDALARQELLTAATADVEWLELQGRHLDAVSKTADEHAGELKAASEQSREEAERLEAELEAMRAEQKRQEQRQARQQQLWLRLVHLRVACGVLPERTVHARALCKRIEDAIGVTIESARESFAAL